MRVKFGYLECYLEYIDYPGESKQSFNLALLCQLFCLFNSDTKICEHFILLTFMYLVPYLIVQSM